MNLSILIEKKAQTKTNYEREMSKHVRGGEIDRRKTSQN